LGVAQLNRAWDSDVRYVKSLEHFDGRAKELQGLKIGIKFRLPADVFCQFHNHSRVAFLM